MYKIMSHCPVCANHLHATRLTCSHCATIVENTFELTKFDYLNREQLAFVETFIKCRGNIKEVEKELGISYPTVRSKLDEVIECLGYQSKESKVKIGKLAVLEALEQGELSVEEAIEQLKKQGE